MRRHPPKISRKKLVAEIKSLRGQCLTWQMIVMITSQVSALQIDVMKSAYGSPPFAQGGIVQEGTPVSVNNTEGMALSSEQVAELEKLVKEINIEGRS